MTCIYSNTAHNGSCSYMYCALGWVNMHFV